MNIVDVPRVFRMPQVMRFPTHQMGEYIEQFAERFFSGLNQNDYSGEYWYLPIYYSAWYHNHCGDNRVYNYDDKLLELMVDYIISLPRDRKYFTVCRLSKQGWLEDALKEINCLVFGAGGWGDVAIPLISDNHRIKRVEQPEYLASFVGSLKTHPIRQKIYDELYSRKGFYICESGANIELFENIMANSYFALCPRGYGPTSFRLYEAIQIGVVPVYITDDEPWTPFKDKIDWNKLVLFVKSDVILALPELLDALKGSNDYQKMIEYGQFCYERYFTYRGTCWEVLNIIKEREKCSEPSCSAQVGSSEAI